MDKNMMDMELGLNAPEKSDFLPTSNKNNCIEINTNDVKFQSKPVEIFKNSENDKLCLLKSNNNPVTSFSKSNCKQTVTSKININKNVKASATVFDKCIHMQSKSNSTQSISSTSENVAKSKTTSSICTNVTRQQSRYKSKYETNDTSTKSIKETVAPPSTHRRFSYAQSRSAFRRNKVPASTIKDNIISATPSNDAQSKLNSGQSTSNILQCFKNSTPSTTDITSEQSNDKQNFHNKSENVTRKYIILSSTHTNSVNQNPKYTSAKTTSNTSSYSVNYHVKPISTFSTYAQVSPESNNLLYNGQNLTNNTQSSKNMISLQSQLNFKQNLQNKPENTMSKYILPSTHKNLINQNPGYTSAKTTSNTLNYSVNYYAKPTSTYTTHVSPKCSNLVKNTPRNVFNKNMKPTRNKLIKCQQKSYFTQTEDIPKNYNLKSGKYRYIDNNKGNDNVSQTFKKTDLKLSAPGETSLKTNNKFNVKVPVVGKDLERSGLSSNKNIQKPKKIEQNTNVPTNSKFETYGARRYSNVSTNYNKNFKQPATMNFRQHSTIPTQCSSKLPTNQNNFAARNKFKTNPTVKHYNNYNNWLPHTNFIKSRQRNKLHNNFKNLNEMQVKKGYFYQDTKFMKNQSVVEKPTVVKTEEHKFPTNEHSDQNYVNNTQNKFIKNRNAIKKSTVIKTEEHKFSTNKHGDKDYVNNTQNEFIENRNAIEKSTVIKTEEHNFPTNEYGDKDYVNNTQNEFIKNRNAIDKSTVAKTEEHKFPTNEHGDKDYVNVTRNKFNSTNSQENISKLDHAQENVETVNADHNINHENNFKSSEKVNNERILSNSLEHKCESLKNSDTSISLDTTSNSLSSSLSSDSSLSALSSKIIFPEDTNRVYAPSITRHICVNSSKKKKIKRKFVHSRCGHTFCKYCIIKWLRKHDCCATCRKPITLRDLRTCTSLQSEIPKISDNL